VAVARQFVSDKAIAVRGEQEAGRDLASLWPDHEIHILPFVLQVFVAYLESRKRDTPFLEVPVKLRVGDEPLAVPVRPDPARRAYSSGRGCRRAPSPSSCGADRRAVRSRIARSRRTCPVVIGSRRTSSPEVR
jgi:hypothetical protein